MNLNLVTPPTREPLSLSLIKEHLKVDSDFIADDNAIQGLITTARTYCEGAQNRAYLTQTWELWFDGWPSMRYIDMPLPPLQSVEYIRYYGSGDTEYTLDTDDYDVDAKGFVGRVALKYLKTWPTTTLRPSNAVTIRFVAGYKTYTSTVSANVTAVTRSAGDNFETTWQAGKLVTINGVTYRLASVTSASALVLATTAGTQTSVPFLTDDVPETFKQAMILQVKLLYDDYEPRLRERMELARDRLLGLERVYPV